MNTTFKKGQRVKVEYKDYRGKSVSYYSTIEFAGICKGYDDFVILGDLSICENAHVKEGQEYYFVPRSSTSGGSWLSVNCLWAVKTR